MRLRPAPILLALAMLLPGCFGHAGEPSPAASPARDPAPSVPETQAPAPPAVEPADDAFVVDTNMTPEGSITAFEWVVPDGALIEFLPPMNGAETSDLWTVMVEAGFLFPDGTTPSVANWAVLVYRVEDNGTVSYLTPVVKPTVHHQPYTTSPGAIQDVAPSLDAFRFRIGPNTVKEGQRITFVLLLQGERSPVRFAFRTIYEMPDQYAFPIDEFTSGFPANPQHPAVLGTGTGFQIAYFELNMGKAVAGTVGAPATDGYVDWTDGFSIEDSFPVDTPAFTSSRLLTLTSTDKAAGGTTHGGGLYASTSATGTWKVDMDCYGETFGANSVVTEAGDVMLVVQDQTFGTPWWNVDQTGRGDCRVQFGLDLAGVNGHERLYFRLVHYDSSTDLLFQRALNEFAWAHLGRVGSSAPRA